jgi:leucyl aminopeptidase
MAVAITTKTGDATTAQADALILPVAPGASVPDTITGAFDGQLAVALETNGFGGKRGDLVAYPTFGKLGARTLVLTGLGEQTGEPGRWGEALRRAYGAAIKKARDEGARKVAAVLPEGADAAAISAVVEGLTLALYRFTRYKTGDAATPKKQVEAIELWSSGPISSDAVAHGQAVAAGVELARDLVNIISNDKTPPQIAEIAREVATESELGFTMLDKEALEAGGYQSILTVGKGSSADPRLVELTYEPAGGATRTIALVGKTITFDSGGLDLKTADGMYSMKSDMGGGASVLGAMKAIAMLQPKVRVVGIMTAAENMPSGTAMRPSDVVKALNGKTFEIGNTDAEGRMVLADAVTHAARLGADEIIDLAPSPGPR